MTTAVATVKPEQQASPIIQLRDFLSPRKSQLTTYGASDPDRMVQIALLEFSSRDDLRNCTPESIYIALAISAQLGLIPSSALGEAFLVPFKGKCTLIPGWKGYVKQAHRSKMIRSLTSDVVYEKDDFHIELGTEPRVHHIPALRGRGDIIGAVSIAKLVSSETYVEWMPIEDLERVRAAAEKGGRQSPAYRDWADQMYRKAPLRRLCKRLPLGDEYARTAAVDELTESGNTHRLREVVSVPEQLEERNDRAPAAQQLAGAVASRAAAVRNDQTTAPPADVIDVEPVLEEQPAGPPTPAELVEMLATCADSETLTHLLEVRASIWSGVGEEDRQIVIDAEKAASKRIGGKAKK